MKNIAVVALGGNALLRSNQNGTIKEQESNVFITCKQIIPLLKEFDSLIITHGNGPQVGNILLRNEAGYNSYKIPKMPLDICVADSQGGIGYLIERQFRNVLLEENINREIVTFVTQIVIDKYDPAFLAPTKPVGPFYLKEEADLLNKSNGWIFKEDPRKRGWRRVVASPQPKEIINTQIIAKLADEGIIVIASGGGGIPVIRNNDGSYQGIEAVIDKDLAAARLALDVHAKELIIFTDISKVYINFRKPGEKALDTLTVEQAERFIHQGEFEAGSMGPKIQAAINFCKNGGEKVLITDAEGIANPHSGTIITN